MTGNVFCPVPCQTPYDYLLYGSNDEEFGILKCSTPYHVEAVLVRRLDKLAIDMNQFSLQCDLLVSNFCVAGF